MALAGVLTTLYLGNSVEADSVPFKLEPDTQILADINQEDLGVNEARTTEIGYRADFRPRSNRLGDFENFTMINPDGSIRDPELLPKDYVVALQGEGSRYYHNGTEVGLGPGQDSLGGGEVRITNVGTDASGRTFDSIIELKEAKLLVPSLRLLNNLEERKFSVRHVYSDDSPVLVPLILSFNFTPGTQLTIKQDDLYAVIGDKVAEDSGALTSQADGYYKIRPGSGIAGLPGISNTNLVVRPELDLSIINTLSVGGLYFYRWNGIWMDVDTPAPVVTGANIANYQAKAPLFEISQQIPRSTEKGKFQTFSMESTLNSNLLVAAEDIEIKDSSGTNIKDDFEVTVTDNLLRIVAKDPSQDSFYERYLKVKVVGQLDMDKMATWAPLITSDNELIFPAQATTVVDESKHLASNEDDITFQNVNLPSTLTVKFQDLAGNPLATDKVTTYEYGQEYTATAQDLSGSGWTLDSSASSQTGVMAGQDVEVIFEYRRGQVTVKTEYYKRDQTGKLTPLFGSHSDDFEYGQPYTTESKKDAALAMGLVLESSDSGDPVSGTTGTKDETLTVKYIYVDGLISLSVPAEIDFGQQKLITVHSRDIAPTENIKVSIIDELAGKWDLMLAVSEELISDVDDTAIKGEFRFIQDDGTTVEISKTPKVIYSKKAAGVIDGVDLEWDIQESKGLIFKQLPGNTRGGYSGTFTWTLQDGY